MTSERAADAHSVPTERSRPARPVWPAMRLGALGKCPACGNGRLFGRYLKVEEHCGHCREALHHQRADDAPAYMTILAVGHIVVPLILALERASVPPMWLHAVLWLPLTLVLTLAILPMMKGALIGLQWALRMHGFDPEAEPEGVAAAPARSTR